MSAWEDPATAGEREVVDFFKRHLSRDWEVYAQPHLNGLRPDVVLLNPAVGLAVFEVKDWDLTTARLRPGGAAEEPVIELVRDGQVVRRRDPLSQVRQYKDELQRIYCPTLGEGEKYRVMTAGVIFTRASTAVARRALEVCEPKSWEPVSGADALQGGRLLDVFPDAQRRSSYLMTDRVARELRHWLVEPEHVREQRQAPVLNSRQRELASRRNQTGYLRVRGPAGSGKSMVLAARAARLADEGNDVLIVSYNLSLLPYLTSLLTRFRGSLDGITALGFHAWAKRTLTEAGRAAEYHQLWRNGTDHATGAGIANALASALADPEAASRVSKYDAILVDEGQDFRLDWWNALRGVLRPGGDAVLVADRAQDLYGNGVAWTEETMQGAGFRGKWNELEVVYRTPSRLLGLLELYRAGRLPTGTEAVAMPHVQEELAYTELRWRQTTQASLLTTLLDEVDDYLRSDSMHAASDLHIVVDRKELGFGTLAALADCGVSVTTTLSRDEHEARRLKQTFHVSDSRIRLTTVHSFKGWEAPVMVVGLADPRPEITYTALSRLSRADAGSWLSVVSCVPEHEEFGRMWPAFRST